MQIKGSSNIIAHIEHNSSHQEFNPVNPELHSKRGRLVRLTFFLDPFPPLPWVLLTSEVKWRGPPLTSKLTSRIAQNPTMFIGNPKEQGAPLMRFQILKNDKKNYIGHCLKTPVLPN
eukprot:EG_transcript_38949